MFDDEIDIIPCYEDCLKIAYRSGQIVQNETRVITHTNQKGTIVDVKFLINFSSKYRPAYIIKLDNDDYDILYYNKFQIIEKLPLQKEV